ncbi:MAG TPA: toll/interleukin-1 receptor domain-containing protein [Bryobacteraceae bacterium]
MVPGRKHDLFLSYAHEETAWANDFRKALRDKFKERTGRELTFWQDTRNIRANQTWEKEIEDAIRDAAAFLGIFSPTYLNDSDWCLRERNLSVENGLDALKVQSPAETLYRLFKIYKNPHPTKADEAWQGLQGIPFFNRATEEALLSESAEFKAQLVELFRQIRDLLVLMSNSARKVYLAPTAISVHQDRRRLEVQLTDKGFAVRPVTKLGPGLESKIREEMEEASHAVFILGASYDGFIEAQVKEARYLGTPCLFWVQRGAEQRKLTDRIHELGLPPGSEVLWSRTAQDFFGELSDRLEPKDAPSPPPPIEGLGRVYVNHDGAPPEDPARTARIADLVRAHRFQPLQNGRDGDHDRLMEISDGVLVFRAAMLDPDWWLRSMAMELAHSERTFGAKALLVANPTGVPKEARALPVYPYADQLDPNTLDPFFEQLRGAQAANAR